MENKQHPTNSTLWLVLSVPGNNPSSFHLHSLNTLVFFFIKFPVWLFQKHPLTLPETRILGLELQWLLNGEKHLGFIISDLLLSWGNTSVYFYYRDVQRGFSRAGTALLSNNQTITVILYISKCKYLWLNGHIICIIGVSHIYIWMAYIYCVCYYTDAS